MNLEISRSSFSQYSSFMTCPRKYYWQYIKGIVPVEEADYYRIGREFHKGAEGKEQPLTMWEKIGALADRYFPKRKGEQHEVRKDFNLEHGLDLTVIADMVCDEAVGEYKTTSRANSHTVQAQMLSMQLRLEAIAFDKPVALLRMVKKPLIRQKKDESPEQFDARYLNEFIEKPDEHFLEVTVPVIKEGAIKEFLFAVQMMNSCKSKDIWPMAAPYSCYGLTACPYLPMCSDEETNGILFKEKEPR